MYSRPAWISLLIASLFVFPAISSAAISNVANVTYQDANGTVYSGQSNQVTTEIVSCTAGESRNCTITGCAGLQTCVAGAWGSCVKDDLCCGVSCDDGNSCTTDGCSLGVCAHTTISGCGKSSGGGSSGGGTSKECYTEGQNRSCGSDVGQCSPGTQTCVSWKWSECAGSVEPGMEVCNRLDDDCDGQVDEGLVCECYLGQTRACGLETGECIAGYRICSGGNWSLDCTGEVGPTEEICDNGLDDDCDAEVDEGDCLFASDINCSDGMITQSCLCGGKTYAAGAGFCQNDFYFAEEPNPPFPWEFVSYSGGIAVTVTLLVLVIREVRRFGSVRRKVKPEEQYKVRVNKKRGTMSVTEVRDNQGEDIGNELKINGYIKLSSIASDNEYWYSLYDDKSTLAIKSAKRLKEGYVEIKAVIRKTQLEYVFAEVR